MVEVEVITCSFGNALRTFFTYSFTHILLIRVNRATWSLCSAYTAVPCPNPTAPFSRSFSSSSTRERLPSGLSSADGPHPQGITRRVVHSMLCDHSSLLLSSELVSPSHELALWITSLVRPVRWKRSTFTIPYLSYFCAPERFRSLLRNRRLPGWICSGRMWSP
jgi:hypothetical protein